MSELISSMNHIISLIKGHRLIATNLLILFVSYYSFHYYIERLLTPKLGMGWAFLIDQTIPLVITVLTFILIIKKGISLNSIHAKFKNHYLLIALIFIVAVITHLGTLAYYFWSDEVIIMLQPITQNNEFLFHTQGGANMRGYFIASYDFLYLVFGVLHAWIYPLFNIIAFAVSTIFVYWFLYLLTNKKLIATLSSLFFATTPMFLDMFTWHSTGQAPILILGLASFITLLYFKKSGLFFYYIISLMFFFVAIKMGFVRSIGLTLIPLFLLFLPIYRTKKTIWNLLAYSTPYIMITIYFVLFEFIYLELVTAYAIFQNTRSFGDVINYLLRYREFNGAATSLLLPKLSFFSSYLLVPGGLIGDILPSVRPFLGKFSIALTLGNLILLGFLFSCLTAFKYRRTKGGWLVIFAIIFILINMLHSVIGYQAPDYFNPNSPGSAGFLDQRLSREDAGYGPGSRYLFISSVGVSLLFGIFVTWLAKKRQLLIFSAIFCFIVLSGNTYYTIRAQVKNFNSMAQYKSLVENIFKTVPRDGKPKILFSGNPEKNGLDTKFSGWPWINGFYKHDELVYTKDPKEVAELIRQNHYKRENLYAFYNNPHTLSFSDISEEARNYFFPNDTDIHIPTNLIFQSPKQRSREFTLPGSTVNLVQRAAIESEDVQKQIIVPQNLRFKLNIQRAKFPSLPLSDTFFINKGTGEKYLYNFPIALWEQLALPPIITNNPADIQGNVNTREKQFRVLNILQKRSNLMEGTSIDISNMADKGDIEKESLIDGFFTNYPTPRINERFFLSKENSVDLTFALPFVTGVRRILLNTPDKYSPNAPKKITIFSSLDGTKFEEIATLENQIADRWSPNRGKMYHIDLPETTYAKFLWIKLGNSKPVALDEIVVDGEEALNFSPQDIYETARQAYAYVENQELFDQLTAIRRYDRLSILWSCAEDYEWQSQLKKISTYPDWSQQKTINEELVNGIWNVAIVTLPPESEVEDSVKINCYGSKLRKVFFISPPYPVEMEVIEATIE